MTLRLNQWPLYYKWVTHLSGFLLSSDVYGIIADYIKQNDPAAKDDNYLNTIFNYANIQIIRIEMDEQALVDVPEKFETLIAPRNLQECWIACITKQFMGVKQMMHTIPQAKVTEYFGGPAWEDEYKKYLRKFEIKNTRYLSKVLYMVGHIKRRENFPTPQEWGIREWSTMTDNWELSKVIETLNLWTIHEERNYALEFLKSLPKNEIPLGTYLYFHPEEKTNIDKQEIVDSTPKTVPTIAIGEKNDVFAYFFAMLAKRKVKDITVKDFVRSFVFDEKNENLSDNEIKEYTGAIYDLTRKNKYHNVNEVCDQGTMVDFIKGCYKKPDCKYCTQMLKKAQSFFDRL